MRAYQQEDETELLEKLRSYFPGKIVRQDLTKKIKEGAKSAAIK